MPTKIYQISGTFILSGLLCLLWPTVRAQIGGDARPPPNANRANANRGRRTPPSTPRVNPPRRTPTTRTPSRTTSDPAATERVFWESIRESRDAEDFRAYLSRYPNGQFVDLARNRIRTLEAAAAERTRQARESEAANAVAAERTYWESIRSSANQEDFRAYLRRYPSGQFVDLARNRLNELEAAARPASTTATAPAPPRTTTSRAPVRNQYGMEMVWIPAGSFQMGSTNGEAEQPVHQVTIRDGFYMGRYEVTQGQWQAVMGNNPSRFSNCGANCPVEQVSWNDAQEFLRRLNGSNDGYTYRLPSEAEWEYAARAGTTADYAGNLDQIAWYGNNSGNNPLDAVAIYAKDSANYYKRIMENGGQTHPVGQKQPNAFGLYDMHGNVWEWCQDYWHDSYAGAPTDGSARVSGGDSNRVLRGGSWVGGAGYLRSAVRGRSEPGNRLYIFGFRVVADART